MRWKAASITILMTAKTKSFWEKELHFNHWKRFNYSQSISRKLLWSLQIKNPKLILDKIMRTEGTKLWVIDKKWPNIKGVIDLKTHPQQKKNIRIYKYIFPFHLVNTSSQDVSLTLSQTSYALKVLFWRNSWSIILER